jgi:hypothetical protein
MREVAIRNLYIGYLSQKVLTDTLVRYMAGYKAGDFRKECEKMAESSTPAELQDLLISDPNFDIARFAAIAEEINQVMSEERKAKQQAEELAQKTIVAPDGKPALRIVK